MFKVGKKYQHDTCKDIITVIGPNPVRENETVVVYNKFGKTDSIPNNHCEKYYTPYHEPIKYVRYFSFYRDGISTAYLSRTSADKQAGIKRIGCKRVEFIEGEYDA